MHEGIYVHRAATEMFMMVVARWFSKGSHQTNEDAWNNVNILSYFLA
jgi:hypothetical protein